MRDYYTKMSTTKYLFEENFKVGQFKQGYSQPNQLKKEKKGRKKDLKT